MAEKTVSQSQHEPFRKVVEEGVGRMGAWLDEVGKLESKSLEQTRAAVDEAARLTRDGLAYGAQLSAEWRRLALETARRAAELWMPRA